MRERERERGRDTTVNQYEQRKGEGAENGTENMIRATIKRPWKKKRTRGQHQQ